MYLSVHGTAALVIAQATPQPWLAFIFSFISHLILDLVPHGDEFIVHGFPKTKALRRLTGAAIIDGVVLVFLLASYIVSSPAINLPTVGWALVGALLPDLLEAIYLTTDVPLLKAWSKFHQSLHNWFKHKLHWTEGIIVQVMVLTALWLLAI